MQAPAKTSSAASLIRFGRYVTTRLRRADATTLSEQCASATSNVKTASRAWEDKQEPVQDAIASRDHADGLLDAIAKKVRRTLLARRDDAKDTSPYIDVFPQKLSYYTVAPLAQEKTRYEELSERMQAHLPSDDELLAEVPGIQQSIADFAQYEEEVAQGRRDLRLARTALNRTNEEWFRIIEKTYGTLLTEEGRRVAETFFPKIRKSPSGNATDNNEDSEDNDDDA